MHPRRYNSVGSSRAHSSILNLRVAGGVLWRRRDGLHSYKACIPDKGYQCFGNNTPMKSQFYSLIEHQAFDHECERLDSCNGCPKVQQLRVHGKGVLEPAPCILLRITYRSGLGKHNTTSCSVDDISKRIPCRILIFSCTREVSTQPAFKCGSMNDSKGSIQGLVEIG
jgi:hypothetical protein